MHFPTIGICILALFFVVRKTPYTSFDILLINLLLLNSVTMTAVAIISQNVEVEVLPFVLQIILICTYHWQSVILLVISAQRTVMVFYPIRAQIWITKRKTITLLVVMYVFVVILVAVFICVRLLLKEELIAHKLLFAGGIVITIEIVVMVVLNIGILYKVVKRSKNLETNSTQTTATLKKNKNTIRLLVSMAFSAVVVYLALVIKIFIGYEVIYTRVVWIDPYTNAMAYLMLKTNLFGKIKNTICCCCSKKKNTELQDSSTVSTISRL